MFEAIVERILKQKLGKYLEGIASKNLNFAVYILLFMLIDLGRKYLA